jgi:hypothetical protein
MKTKEEVLKHLKQTGYSKKSAFKILGFLIAKEYTEIGENIEFTSGERTFEDFVNWFNSKEVKKTKLEAYKEIVDFLMSNVKDVPSYWLEYLNNDIKLFNILNNQKPKTFLGNETLNELDKQVKNIADDIVDSYRGLEIFFRK